MAAYSRSPESKYSRSRHKDRSRSRSRSPFRSERRRSRERQRKSRWNDEDEDRRDYYDEDRSHRHDSRREGRSISSSGGGSRRSGRFSEREGKDSAAADGDYDRDRDRGHRRRDRHDESDHQYGRKDEEDSSSRSKQLSSIPPGPILMFRNLSSFILKEHLTQALGQQMSYIKDIRLITGRDNNTNYAFVEFYTTDDAINWMEANKNGFEVRGCHVNVDFSHHRSIDGGDKRKKDFKWSDWNCFKCGTLNFSRRHVCLTCDCSRAESDSLHEDRRAGLLPEIEAEEESMKNNPPSNVLIFRGLDGLSTEESIQKSIAEVSDIVIKDIRLIRDKATNTSRRFCFVETVTAEEAAELNRVLQEQHPAFFVDGRRINVSYARVNTALPKPANAVAAAAIQQAQAMNMGNSTWQQQIQQQQQQQQYYYYQQQHQQSTSVGTDSSSSQSSSTTSTTATTAPTTSTASTTQEQTAAATTSNVPSTYLYDSTSGFYYDTITGLYYDPKTQYHYNSQTGQYCYYDNTKQAYIPVSADGNPIEKPAETEASKEKKKADTAIVSTGKSAKKIAKDMERWAKSVNTQKAMQQQFINQVAQSQLLQQQQLQQQQTAMEPVLSPVEKPTPISSLDQPVPFGVQEPSISDRPSMYVQAEEDLPPVGEGGDMEFVNLAQLACLLCKRKFNSKEQLMKHIQLSDLHKQNLEKLKSQTSQMTAAEQMVYRDRAKERRAKYGTDAIVPGWKKRFERERAKTVASGDTTDPVPVDIEPPPKTENIGSKMLKAMGWNEGQGLGSKGQGITKPIEAEKRTPSAGLGAPGSNYGGGGIYSSGNDYRATLKSLTKARYDQTFDD